MSKLPIKFVSVWDGFGEIETDATFETESKTVIDIQTADLSPAELKECQHLIAEFVKFPNGEQAEVFCNDDNCTYSFIRPEKADKLAQQYQNPIKMVLVIKGGMLTQVYSTHALDEISVIDFDTQDENEYDEASHALERTKTLVTTGELKKIL